MQALLGRRWLPKPYCSLLCLHQEAETGNNTDVSSAGAWLGAFERGEPLDTLRYEDCDEPQTIGN